MPEQKLFNAMEETSFPRGGGGGGDGRRSSSDNAANELKRKSPSAASSASAETDFLFGRKDNLKSPSKKSSKKRKTSSSTGGGAQSMLPLGGGGVVIPSSTSSKKKSTVPVIEALGFSKLAKSTKVLAVVREVQNEYAVVSLPNLLTGYILPSDSPTYPLPTCLKIGQTLAVVVQKVVTENVKGSTTPRRRIQVTAHPRAVNVRDGEMFQKKNLPVRGQIVSVEDHGCLVDLGLGRKGFLKFNDIDGKYSILEDGDEDEEDYDEANDDNNKHVLRSGRLLDFYISSSSVSSDSSSKTSQVYSLSLPSKKALTNHVVSPPGSSKSAPYTLASIMPGWLVSAKIEAMAKNGLCVTFLGNVFRGAVEMSHLGGYQVPTTNSKDNNDDGSSWKALFHKHQHFQARIIAVDIPTKLIRLTLLPHLLELKAPPALPSVGTIVKDCTVIKNDPGIGALLAMPDSYSGESCALSKKMIKTSELFQNSDFQDASRVRAVYVHISKAQDGEKDATSASTFSKEFAISTKHSVRILSCGNWMDGVASGACAPSILEAHVLTHADLQAGQLYRQVPVVAQLQGGSVLVQLGGSAIRALIPPLHLVDSSNANSEYRKKVMKTKYAVDAKVDVRVLWVDSKKKKCLATAKKSLVKAPETEIVSSYEDLKLGDKATGFISKIDDKALYVTFCNRVYGKVTSRSLAAELGIENVQDNYTEGDVVTCRVVKLKKRSKRRSSLSMDSDDEDSDNENGRPGFYELTLSLNVDDSVMEGGDLDHDKVDAKNPKQIRVQAGAILPMKSMKIVELVKGKTKAKGSFVPGYAIVSIKSKHLLDGSECESMLSNMECKLPYDQILDEYPAENIETVEDLDALAEKVLTIGKKINQKGIILTDPRKTNVDYSNGIGRLTVVSLRKKLIKAAEDQYSSTESSPEDIILPSPKSKLFVGALLQGYVAQIDSRYGAFVRFLDGLTGMIMKKQGGLDMPLFETIVTRVRAIDESKGHLLLEAVNQPSSKDRNEEIALPVKIGDKVDAKILQVNFYELVVTMLSDASSPKEVRSVVHITMKDSEAKDIKIQKKSVLDANQAKRITKGHPFYGLKVGQKLKALHVASVNRSKGRVHVHLTDRALDSFVSKSSVLEPGKTASAIVTGIAPRNKGLYVEASPFVKGFIPGLEVSKDLNLLNNMNAHVPIGARIDCMVVDQNQFKGNRSKKDKADNTNLIFSILGRNGESSAPKKPASGDLVIGRIQKGLQQANPPALMVALKDGFIGRCCLTELDESDEWENMPIGRISKTEESSSGEKAENAMDVDEDEEKDDESNEESDTEIDTDDVAFADGKYIECRVMKSGRKQAPVEVSLRSSRIEGDLDDDVPPEAGDIVQAYVIETNKKGCFVRLARNVEGRVTLKELCDGFLPNPAASFQPGRLVVGKIKEIRDAVKKSKNADVKFQVDLDMRESTLLDQKKKLVFEDVELNSKHKGTVTRVESYGVFVQIENSNVSGLVHMSECSDKFIKNLSALYDPGDLVKILVVKKDAENRKLGFSMKASHFEDDEDSDDDSSVDDDSLDDQEMLDVEDAYGDGSEEELDSDDENFGAKLAARMKGQDSDADDDDAEEDEEKDGSSSDSSNDSDDDDEEEDSSSDSDSDAKPSKSLMDTDIGFDWGAKGLAPKKSHHDDDDSSDSDSDDDNSDDEMDKTSSHKSRKKQAQRRREEQEITRRETALADGTADENPETAGDFERLLAGNPNSSELWIRYMAFYLSLADIPSARNVAEKALDRIEFREEREKLNVWTALLTLEHKYGSDKTLDATIDKACNQCNPKRVYLRVCEILEKDVVAPSSSSSPESIVRADDMFSKMCKKFKSKKKVWLAHLEYLLKQSRHQDAHALLKRALLSLASYKHAETMSKFAQLEFEYGSAERARTVFDGIMDKYSKRLDLFFVYLDKEVKFGTISNARSLLERKVEEAKLSDKQMKSVFKKWFRIEEEHGTEEQQEHVKDTARAYVQRTTSD